MQLKCSASTCTGRVALSRLLVVCAERALSCSVHTADHRGSTFDAFHQFLPCIAENIKDLNKTILLLTEGLNARHTDHELYLVSLITWPAARSLAQHQQACSHQVTHVR